MAGSMLLLLIRRAGIEQRQLAQAAGLRQSRVSQILRGRADAQPHERRAIAAALDLHEHEQDLFNENPELTASLTALLARRAHNIAHRPPRATSVSSPINVPAEMAARKAKA
jgi:transcriptional regulator with XRE-family HTH domain